VHPGHKLTGPKEEEEEQWQLLNSVWRNNCICFENNVKHRINYAKKTVFYVIAGGTFRHYSV
jgi:hypothetical protein